MTMNYKEIEQLKKANRWQEIIASLRPLVDEGDKDVYRLSALGFAYSQLNMYDQARYCYKLWLEKEAHRAQPYYSIGYTYYDDGRWSEAVEWFDRALEIFPSYIVCLYRKGVAQFNMYKYHKAEETLSESIKAFQQLNDEQSLKRNAKYYYKSVFYLGKTYYAMDKFNKALICFKKIDEEDKRDYIDPLFKRYNLAKAYFGLQEYVRAEEILQELQDKKWNKEYVLDLQAQVKVARKEFGAAADLFNRALQKRPASYIYIHRARFYEQQGQLNKALADYHQALRRDRLGKHKILLALGKIAQKQNKWQQAINYFTKAIEFKKRVYEADYYEGRLALADAYKQTGQEEKAKEEYSIAAQLQNEWGQYVPF